MTRATRRAEGHPAWRVQAALSLDQERHAIRLALAASMRAAGATWPSIGAALRVSGTWAKALVAKAERAHARDVARARFRNAALEQSRVKDNGDRPSDAVVWVGDPRPWIEASIAEALARRSDTTRLRKEVCHARGPVGRLHDESPLLTSTPAPPATGGPDR